MISIRLRRMYRRLSYFTGFFNSSRGRAASKPNYAFPACGRGCGGSRPLIRRDRFRTTCPTASRRCHSCIHNTGDAVGGRMRQAIVPDGPAPRLLHIPSVRTQRPALTSSPKIACARDGWAATAQSGSHSGSRTIQLGASTCQTTGRC